MHKLFTAIILTLVGVGCDGNENITDSVEAENSSQRSLVYQSENMLPLIRRGQSVAVIEPLEYIPEYGEVVLVLPAEDQRLVLSRVIGLPGDLVEISEGRVIINDEMLRRNFIQRTSYQTHEGTSQPVSLFEEVSLNGSVYRIYEKSDSEPLDNIGPFLVPQNSYFLMGDNRDQSADSRISTGLGYVNSSEFLGYLPR